MAESLAVGKSTKSYCIVFDSSGVFSRGDFDICVGGTPTHERKTKAAKHTGKRTDKKWFKKKKERKKDTRKAHTQTERREKEEMKQTDKQTNKQRKKEKEEINKREITK